MLYIKVCYRTRWLGLYPPTVFESVPSSWRKKKSHQPWGSTWPTLMSLNIWWTDVLIAVVFLGIQVENNYF